MPALNAPAEKGKGGRARAATRQAGGAQTTIGSVGDRVIALFFDRLVIASILLVIGAYMTEAHYRIPTGATGFAEVGGAIFAVTFLYHFLIESMFLTTVGKAAMGLHVGVEDDRNRIAAIAIRNVLRLVDALGFYLIGFLFATFTLKKQRVGDLVGHTVVVDWPIARGGRAAVMFLVVAILVAACWIAYALCPACGNSVTRLVSLRPQ